VVCVHELETVYANDVYARPIVNCVIRAFLNNNNTNSHDNVYGAVIMTQSHSESSPGSSDECRLRVAANPQTKPVDLGCESAENWQLSSTSTIAIVIITQPIG